MDIGDLVLETENLTQHINAESDALCQFSNAMIMETTEPKINSGDAYVALLQKFTTLSDDIANMPFEKRQIFKAAVQSLNFALDRNAGLLKSHYRRTQSMLEQIASAAALTPQTSAYSAAGLTVARPMLAPVVINAQV
jgi:hypothetical protein